MSATVTWPVFHAGLLNRETIVERTMSFRFAKPADGSYRAGQFVDITLLDPPETDAEGNTRGFSISSAPRDGAGGRRTGLRSSPAAQRHLLEHVLEGRIAQAGRDHDHVHADRPAVLLAGGIGITPFRSILVETIGGGSLPFRVVLFHANRRPEGAAFADECRALEHTDPNLTFVPTMTATAGSTHAWGGEQGHIDAAMLGRHLDGLIDPIYNVAGPAGMVQASRAMLVASGVDEDDIRTEEFTGY